jgi:hypothetical protein
MVCSTGNGDGNGKEGDMKELLKAMVALTFCAVVAVALILQFVPGETMADAGDGDQVFSHSILEGKVGTSEIEDNSITGTDLSNGLVIDGDSLGVTATKTNIYSDSVVFGDTASIVIDHQVIGDSVSVTATATKIYGTLDVTGDLGAVNITASGDVAASGDSVTFTATATKVYGDFYLADCGVDSMSIDGDSSQVISCSAVTADSTDCVIFITELTDPVGFWYRKHQFAGGFGIASDGTETVSPGWFYWMVFRKAE